MKVERIERSKHKQERVLVYLEGGDLLRITESELLRFGLCIGLDIDDRTVVELQQSGARSETRVRAANMISSRPLSRKELAKKLREKGSVEADAESACDWLEEIGALNDAEYAAMLVRHYGGMGYGEAKIRDELYRRGVMFDNLFDSSFGEGVMPICREGIVFEDRLQGYAGGLGPENIKNELDKINDVNLLSAIVYVDAEGHLKGEDGSMSLDKARDFICKILQWEDANV